MKLAEKNVLITGAARGIGKATAIELARAGANIIGIDLRDEDLAETATAVTHLGRQFHAYACDVSDEAATRALVAAIIAATGGFDVLVNNAGVLPSGPFLERDFAVWRRAIDINLTGLMALTYIALPHLLRREQAHIVNLASIAGKYGSEGVIAYAASKHGVVGFSSGLREELAHTAVGVSWICPSHARTRLIAGVKPSFMTPEVEPEQVARAIRRAIERNASEVFVPHAMRFIVAILPNVLPNLSRRISRWTKASRGWLEAKKEITA